MILAFVCRCVTKLATYYIEGTLMVGNFDEKLIKINVFGFQLFLCNFQNFLNGYDNCQWWHSVTQLPIGLW